MDRSLAIAGGTAGTVTIVDPEKDFARTAEISVGGAPRRSRPPTSADPWLRRRPLRGSAGGRRERSVVHVLLRTATGLVPQAPLRLAEPNGTADLVAVDDLNDDSRQDVIVSDRASKSLVVFDNRGGSGFAPPRTLAAGIDPVSLLVGDFGGDWQHRDVALADARATPLFACLLRAIRWSLPAPMRTTRPPTPGCWPGRTSRARAFTDSPYARGAKEGCPDRPVHPTVRAARRPPYPRAPRHRLQRVPSRPLFTEVWDVVARRERPLHIKLASSCRVAAVAVWDRSVAYEVGDAPKRTCPGKGGIWLRGPRGRPVRRGSGGSATSATASPPGWPIGHRATETRSASPPSTDASNPRADRHRLPLRARASTITHGHLVYGINTTARAQAASTSTACDCANAERAKRPSPTRREWPSPPSPLSSTQSTATTSSTPKTHLGVARSAAAASSRSTPLAFVGDAIAR